MVPHDLNNEELGIKDVWNFNLEAEFDTISSSKLIDFEFVRFLIYSFIGLFENSIVIENLI